MLERVRAFLAHTRIKPVSSGLGEFDDKSKEEIDSSIGERIIKKAMEVLGVDSIEVSRPDSDDTYYFAITSSDEDAFGIMLIKTEVDSTTQSELIVRNEKSPKIRFRTRFDGTPDEFWEVPRSGPMTNDKALRFMEEFLVSEVDPKGNEFQRTLFDNQKVFDDLRVRQV